MNAPEFVYTVLLKPKPLRAVANALLRAIIPRTQQVGPATIALNPRDPVVSGALALRAYENDEIRYFCSHLRGGMTFVDVGANVGLYTGLAIKLGAEKILAVEPHPEAFSYLQHTVQANIPTCPVFLEPCAAGSAPGELTLYSNSQNKGDSRLYPDKLLDEKQNVRVETLDALCLKHGIEKIDFLKIDVQGAEMLAIQGATHILENSPDCIIMTEFWPFGLEACGSDPIAYLRVFLDSERSVFELRNGSLLPVDARDLTLKTTGRQYLNLIVTPPEK